MEQRSELDSSICSLTNEVARLLRTSGITVCSLTILIEFASTITELLTFKLQSFVLSLYLVLFVVATLFAELRFIECFRNMTFRFLKHIYFVSSYTGRGLLYIFMGTLLFDTAIGYILGVAMILIGLTNILAANLCPGKLPVYADKWAVDEDQLVAEANVPSPPAVAKVPPAALNMPVVPSNLHPVQEPPNLASVKGPNPVNPFATPTAVLNYMPAMGQVPSPQKVSTDAGAIGASSSSSSGNNSNSSGVPFSGLGAVATAAFSAASAFTKDNVQSGATWLQEHREHLTVENLDLAAKLAKLTQSSK
eukprot:GGOE01004147.1.p2 GENE.GGOE01004147.1~~GGOE01004147.1.p2  ORF type:complete len:307 (-),score=83.55 GGOE01004147.1:287-1207(-)